MLRRFADLVFQHLLQAFPVGHAYSRSSFDREEMPDAVVHYLVQALDTRLEVEVARVLQTASPWFETEHVEVRAALGALTSALTRRGQFPADEWEATLERAVRNVVSYHARPARTLLEFLFVREGDVYTPAGLQRKLAFFLPYPQLTESLQEFVQREEPEEVGRDAVESLVRRIDEQLEAEFDVSSWMKLLEPLYGIAGILPQYRDGTPVELLVAFFRDKNVPRVEQRLERLHEEDGIDVLTEVDLRRVLQEVQAPPVRPAHTVRHERVVLPEVPVVDAAPPVASALRERPAEKRPVEHPAEPVPLWQRFQQASDDERPVRPVVQAQAQAQQTPRHDRPTPGEAKPLWMRFSEQQAPSERAAPPAMEAPPARPDSLADLERSVLGDRAARDREVFVRALFNGSRDEYEAVLDSLSRTQSWPEASRVIADEVFRRHQVNIYSGPAVSFTNAVEARFEAP